MTDEPTAPARLPGMSEGAAARFDRMQWRLDQSDRGKAEARAARRMRLVRGRPGGRGVEDFWPSAIAAAPEAARLTPELRVRIETELYQLRHAMHPRAEMTKAEILRQAEAIAQAARTLAAAGDWLLALRTATADPLGDPRGTGEVFLLASAALHRLVPFDPAELEEAAEAAEALRAAVADREGRGAAPLTRRERRRNPVPDADTARPEVAPLALIAGHWKKAGLCLAADNSRNDHWREFARTCVGWAAGTDPLAQITDEDKTLALVRKLAPAP